MEPILVLNLQQSSWLSFQSARFINMTSWLAFLTHDLLSFLMVVVLVSLLLLETGGQVEVKANFKYHCVVEDDSELLQPP